MKRTTWTTAIVAALSLTACGETPSGTDDIAELRAARMGVRVGELPCCSPAIRGLGGLLSVEEIAPDRLLVRSSGVPVCAGSAAAVAETIAWIGSAPSSTVMRANSDPMPADEHRDTGNSDPMPAKGK